MNRTQWAGKQINMTKILTPTIAMDFDQLSALANTLDDHGYIEYIFHRLFNDPSAEFQGLSAHTAWRYPECWLARYWLNYVVHGYTLKNASVLDLGANLNFYSVWCLLNGASCAHAVEGDAVRSKLGQEYITLRNLQDRCTTQLATVNEFMQLYKGERYDVVFLQDVLYYLNNHIEVLLFIKDVIKPKFFFLEVSVVADITENGHSEVWYPGVDTKNIQSVLENGKNPLAMMPSRIALRNMIDYTGWKIINYYDYKDFVGHGESPPRKSGMKDYYLLESKQ
jgi:hypothetical protein